MALKGVAGVAVVIVGYVVAGLIGGAIPTNRAWTPPATGITIFVETNGVHTGIVVPKGCRRRSTGARCSRPEDLGDPRYAGFDHVAFGWGERTFYLETPTWADVKPLTVVAAGFGSDRTLVHVDHIPRPRAGEDVRAVVLRPEEYRRLAAYLRASFADRPEHLHGYYDYDAFYPSRGHYSAIRTCNAWTGDALRHAGVRVGAWTPFSWSVMQWF